MRARVVTLNLSGVKDGWFETRRNVAVESLKKLDPDVLCLQETTVSRGSAVYDQARDLGEALGLPVVAFASYGNPIEVMSAEQGGVAIVSRWPIARVRNRRLPAAHESPPDARVALFVTLLTPWGELKIVSTHLSWEPEGAQMRLMQGGLIVDDLAPGRELDPHARTVLAGDINGVETEPVVHLLKGRLTDVYRKRHPALPGYTWLTSNPLTGRYPIADRRLDYIFCTKGTQIHGADVVLNHPAPTYASDHFAVFADLEWP